MDYLQFLENKTHYAGKGGFEPVYIPEYLFDFQKEIVRWAIERGRNAVFADCGLGKGQPEGSKILTPSGFVPNTELSIGQMVIGSDGQPYQLSGIYHRGEQPVYTICFSDGSSYTVDADHLHIVRTNNDRQRNRPWRVISTKELIDMPIRYGKEGKSRNIEIPVVKPVYGQQRTHWIHPYIMGVLLGDGCLTNHCSITIADEQIIETVRSFLPKGWTLKKRITTKYDYKLSKNGENNRSFIQELRRLGLMGCRSSNKFIPLEYLIDSVDNRVWLLRGLMDTDGWIGDTSQFYSTSDLLADDVFYLVRSLGGIPTRLVKKTSCIHNGTRRVGADCHVITFSLKTFNPFNLARKAERWNATPRGNGRWIDRIEKSGTAKTICLSVNSPDNSYVTEHFIVTHNTPMQLAWADNVSRHSNGNVLILTPLAVSQQTIQEGEKFGIEVRRSRDGRVAGNITVTNYEQLTKFNPDCFVGVVCDESSILKNFSGSYRQQITMFMRKMRYRLLCTATAAPNDYTELGTSSEALGVMGYMDMLNYFFKNDQNTSDTKRHWANTGGGAPQWRFKKHAQEPFWKWVCSWARAVRRPSDLGYDNDGFILPPLYQTETVVHCSRPLNGKLFVEPAVGLYEQRQERRATIQERCYAAAEKVQNDKVAVVWCHLNDEGDLLERIIPGAVQVKGGMSDDKKEEALLAFSRGEIRVLVTKPKIGCFGLNWQHCNHMTIFPSHSYEQYYQAVRRCWRFGQKKAVTVDIITTEGEIGVLKNLQRKSDAADQMFSSLVHHMNESISIDRVKNTKNMEVPKWLSSKK